MGHQTRDDILAESQARRERVLQLISADPPTPMPIIAKMEGMHHRALRFLIKELEEQHGITYLGTPGAKVARDAMPYGLSSSTQQLRGRLADHLYQLRQRGNNHAQFGRNEVAPQLGLNAREQMKAEDRPFAHDWSLSQIERLARAMGEDPRDFLLKCLTT